MSLVTVYKFGRSSFTRALTHTHTDVGFFFIHDSRLCTLTTTFDLDAIGKSARFGYIGDLEKRKNLSAVNKKSLSSIKNSKREDRAKKL